MRQSWQVRLTSAFLAALMAGSTCVEPVLAVEQIPVQESAGAGDSALVTSEGTLNVSGMDEDAINTAVEQYLSEQLGVDGTLTVEPRDESGIGAGVSVDGVDAGSVPADSATDSGIGTDTGADGAGDSTVTSPDITITDVTTTEDGLVTVTDSNGNSVTVDEENRSIEATVSIPDAEDAGALSYNKNDEDALEGYEYLGTNTENGAAYYRRQISRSDLPPVDSDAAAREAAEDAAFTEWYHAETISGDAIDQALEQAAAFDSYVQSEYWEQIYGEAVEETALAAETEEADETGAGTGREIVGYRLKAEYADLSMDSPYVSFGEADNVSNGIMLADDALEPEYQTATVMIVDNSKVVLRLLDEDKNGIVGAAVSVTIGGKTQNLVTGLLEGDPDGAAAVVIDLGSEYSIEDALVNISAPGYRGITRTAETLQGGGAKTYQLTKAQQGEIYLRGASIKGVEIYETNYRLYVTNENTNYYDIVAYVEQVGSSPSNVGALQLTNGTRSWQAAGRKNVSYTDSQGNAFGYARFTFNNQWSHYDKDNLILTPDDPTTLQFTDGTSAWANKEAEGSGTLPLRLSISLPAVDKTGGWNASIGFSSTTGVNATLPDQIPGIGGGTFNSDMVAVLPITIHISLDGTLIIGYSDSKDLKECLEEIKKDKPAENDPDQQKKTSSLMDKIEKKYDDLYNNAKKYRDLIQDTENMLEPVAIIDEAKATISWSILGIFHLKQNGGYYSGDLNASFTIAGQYTFTSYAIVVPAYYGAMFKASATVNADIGVKFASWDDLRHWNVAFSDSSGFAVLISLMVQPFLGIGIRNVMSLEVNGSVGFDFLINVIGSNGANDHRWMRFRGYLSGSAGMRAQFLMFKYQKTFWAGNMLLFDSWGVYDPKDTKVPNPITLMSFELSSANDLLASQSALMGTDLRNAAMQEYGLYAQQTDAENAEINIAADGTQTVLQEFKDIDAASTGEDGIQQQALGSIMVSQQMTYVSGDTQGRYFRIANVIDNKDYGGRAVPRVTMMTATEDGLTGTPVALPATEDADGNVYGYDYSYGVYMVDDEYCYVAAVSTSIDPTTSTIEQIANNCRIRLLLMKGTEMVACRMLGKLDNSSRYERFGTKYLYADTPVVYGDITDNKVADIGAYVVACAIQYDLETMVAATAEDAEVDQERIRNNAIYVATNAYFGLTNRRDENARIEYANGVSDLQIVVPDTPDTPSTQQRLALITYLEYDNPTVINAMHVVNSYKACSTYEYPSIDMGGEVRNLQSANQRSGNTLYCTVDGRLTRIQFTVPYNNGARPLQTATISYPVTTDTGENVALPNANGMQVVEAQGSTFLVTCYPQRGDEKEDGTYETDSVITVYTVYEENGAYHIGGPRETVLQNRSVFSAACAVTRKMTAETGYILRMLYLADPESEVISLPSGTLDPANYHAGVTDDVCNLYMWELHTGRGARLNALQATDYYIRKTDQYIYLDATVQNTGAFPADYVTVAVTTDKNNAEGQGDRQDLQIYFSDDNTAYGGNRYSLGPGSTTAVRLQIPMNADWDGVTRLYAAVVKVDGEPLSEGYVPVWIDNGQLLDNGDFTLDVWEDGIGGSPYATVRIENESARSFSNVAIDVEVNRFSDADKWQQGEDYLTVDADAWTVDARYRLDTSDPGTGIDGRTATLHIPLGIYWDDPDVYAVRFRLVGQNDVTLNNVYKISAFLVRPDLPGEADDRVLVYADAEDPMMGNVAVTLPGETVTEDNDGYAYVLNGTPVTFTATASEGYQFSCWEAYDHSTGDWVTLDGGSTMTWEADETLVETDGYNIGEDESTVIVQAVFEAVHATRAEVISVRKYVTTGDDGTLTTAYQQGALNTLLTVYPDENTTGTATQSRATATGAISYLLLDGAMLCVDEPEYDPDEWVFDGWYTYTVDDLGNVTLGDSVPQSVVSQITQSSGVEEVYYAAVFHENTTPVVRVYLDSDGATLAAGSTARIDQWVNVNELHALPGASDLVLDGYIFLGWADDEGYPITDVKALTGGYTTLFAQWQPVTAELAAYAEGSGRVKVAESSESDPGYAVYALDAQATVTATPIGSARFDHWERFNMSTLRYEAVAGAGAEYTFQITGDTSLIAIFTGGSNPGGGDSGGGSSSGGKGHGSSHHGSQQGGSGSAGLTGRTDTGAGNVAANGALVGEAVDAAAGANGNVVGSAAGSTDANAQGGSGSADGSNDYRNATGDDSMIHVWQMMLLTSGMALAMWLEWRRRQD